MSYYKIENGSEEDRSRVYRHIPMLDQLSEPVANDVVTAWVSAWKSSVYESLDDIPYTFKAPHYRLMSHVAEVTEAGMLLAEYAKERWAEVIDKETLLASLILHDVDKPLLYIGSGASMAPSQAYSEIPHGVLGGMLLQELGMSDSVVSVVTTHATTSPFHSSRGEAWVLHYADMFAADHVLRSLRSEHIRPFYQR